MLLCTGTCFCDPHPEGGCYVTGYGSLDNVRPSKAATSPAADESRELLCLV